MKFLIYTVLATALLVAGPAVGQDKKMYKWVDEDGNVSYQDEPPPGESGEVQTFEQSSAKSSPDANLPDIPITLYSIEVCDACDLVRELLDERGLPYTEKDAGGDAKVQAELREVAGVLSVPVLLIGSEVLTGFNRELILNELQEAGFPTVAGGAGARGQAQGDAASASGSGPDGQLTREDLEGMTPQEIEQAARDAALRGEDNDLFEENEGFIPNEDVFPDTRNEPAPDDITQWEEIPDDERIRVGE